MTGPEKRFLIRRCSQIIARSNNMQMYKDWQEFGRDAVRRNPELLLAVVALDDATPALIETAKEFKKC